MSVIKTGLGHDSDPVAAARAAMETTPRPQLAIVFSAFGIDPEQTHRALREVLGDTPIFGGTSAGEFSSIEQAPRENSVVVLTLQSSYLSAGVGTGHNLSSAPEECAREAVRRAYQNLQPNPAVMSLMTIAMDQKGAEASRIRPYVNLILPDGSTSKEEPFMRVLLEETGTGSQVVGGSSANDFKADHTWQFGEAPVRDGAVVAAISSGLKMGTAMGHPYFPSGKGAVVTRASGRTVYELNNRPAVEVIRNLIGSDELDFDTFAQHPFGIKSSDVFGEYTIKSAAAVNEDGSIGFLAEIPEGAYLRYMQSDRGYAIASFKKTLEKAMTDAGNPKKVAAVIVFNCILRHLLKCRLEVDDLAIVREVCGEDVALIGFNTFGEQGMTRGGSLGHYNQTATILVIGDELITQ